MYFLVGVIILIIFICFCYIFFKYKINMFFRKYFGTTDIKNIINEAKLEDQELPKSLSSMDSIYLEQIEKDFPSMNINELKRECEKVLLDVFKAVENKDSSIIKEGKLKSFVDKKISENDNKIIKYKDLKIHKTVVSKYERRNGLATIYFGVSFQYLFDDGVSSVKVQDRAMIEYIYVFDVDKVSVKNKLLGINCPNCGAPIKTLGNKTCSYCHSKTINLVKKTWVCNDFRLY